MLINVIASCNVFAIEPEEKLRDMLETAKEILAAHPAVLELEGDIAVVGDIHGDVESMEAVTEKLTPWLEEDSTRKVLFLGDMFDRGNTTGTFMAFLEFFNKFNGCAFGQQRVFVLRGNHEGRFFFEDAVSRINSHHSIKEPAIKANEGSISEYMDMLPYAAVLNGKTLAVHGGIPGDLDCDDKYSYEQKVRDLFAPKSESEYSDSEKERCSVAINDLLWSDFKESQEEPIRKSFRGVGVEYNKVALKQFLEVLAEVNGKYMDVKHIIRGHDHREAPFKNVIIDEAKEMSHTTVISSLKMCEAYQKDHSSVAWVCRDGKPQEFFRIKRSSECVSSLNIEDCAVKIPTVKEMREMGKKEVGKSREMALEPKQLVKEFKEEEKSLIRKIPGVSLYRYRGRWTYYGYLIDDKEAFERWCEAEGISDQDIEKIKNMQNVWLYTTETILGSKVADYVPVLGKAMKSWHTSNLPEKFRVALETIKNQFTDSGYKDTWLVTNIAVNSLLGEDVKSLVKRDLQQKISDLKKKDKYFHISAKEFEEMCRVLGV